jgi:hypothetical protein
MSLVHSEENLSIGERYHLSVLFCASATQLGILIEVKTLLKTAVDTNSPLAAIAAVQPSAFQTAVFWFLVFISFGIYYAFTLLAAKKMATDGKSFMGAAMGFLRQLADKKKLPTDEATDSGKKITAAAASANANSALENISPSEDGFSSLSATGKGSRIPFPLPAQQQQTAPLPNPLAAPPPAPAKLGPTVTFAEKKETLKTMILPWLTGENKVNDTMAFTFSLMRVGDDNAEFPQVMDAVGVFFQACEDYEDNKDPSKHNFAYVYAAFDGAKKALDGASTVERACTNFIGAACRTKLFEVVVGAEIANIREEWVQHLPACVEWPWRREWTTQS